MFSFIYFQLTLKKLSQLCNMQPLYIDNLPIMKTKNNLKRKKVFFFLMLMTLFLFPTSHIQAQTSFKQLNLQNGHYKVGFQHHVMRDPSRTYQIRDRFTNNFTHRIIPVSIWYPAEAIKNDTYKYVN